MKLTIGKNHKTFKFLINILATIGQETIMRFDTGGLHIFTTSGGLIAADVTFEPQFFDEYEIVGEKEEFCVMFKDLNTPVQKFAQPIVFSEKDGRIEATAAKGTYKMPILDTIQGGIQKLPEINNSCCIDGVVLSELAQAIDVVSTTDSPVVTFYTETGKLLAKSKNGAREMITEVKDVTETCGNVFLSISLLKPILLKTQDTVQFCIQPEKPLLINYNKDGASMKFIVAPRVDDGG